MSVPDQDRIVVDRGGVVVVARGPVILVIDRGTGPLATLGFVLGLLALVSGGFGTVSLIVAVIGEGAVGVPVSVAAIFLIVGIVLAVCALLVSHAIRARRERPLESYRPTAVFDRAGRVYLDGSGTVLAPLDQVRFLRRAQIGSSSPKLVAVTPTGSWVLKRGNPFDGGIGNLDQVLTAAVHGR